MKKQIFLTIGVLQIIFTETSGQIVFQKTYGDSSMEHGYMIEPTNDGGFIITGVTWSWGTSADAYLLKTDSAGNVQWMKKYGGAGEEYGESVLQTDDGGYIVAGSLEIPNTQWGGKAYLLKTDSNGDTLWTKMYGITSFNCGGTSVRQTSDHGYIFVAGADNGLYSTSHLIKTDSLGNIQWTHEYETGISSVLLTPDDGLIVLKPGLSSALIKTDSNGSPIWTKVLTNFNPNYVYLMHTLANTNDAGFVLAGEYREPGFFGCYLVKTDSLGDTLWTKAYHTVPIREIIAFSVQQTSDGGYIAAGLIEDSLGSNNMFALKTDGTGNVVWMKESGSMGFDAGYDVMQTADDGYIISGTTESFGTGSSDIHLIKTDGAGSSGCNESFLNPIVTVPPLQFSISTIFSSVAIVEGSPLIFVNSVVPQQTILCSSFVSIEENTFINESICKVFPNPFTNEISITLQKKNIKHAVIHVKNILGQTVFSKQENNLKDAYTKTVNLNSLSKGIYLLDVSIDGERTVKKILKE